VEKNDDAVAVADAVADDVDCFDAYNPFNRTDVDIIFLLIFVNRCIDDAIVIHKNKIR
jgi:hypothetical protein